MYRLSLIISEIYNKYLPLAEKDGIILNLDFSDTTKQISDPERVKKDLESHLNSALQRSTSQGEITISVDKTAISVTDTGTTLSPSVCNLLSNRFIDVSSRVGFGTTVKIFLQPRDLPAAPTASKPKLELEGAAAAVALDNSSPEPTLQTEAKLATKRGKSRRTLGARLQLKGKKTTTPKKAKTTPAKSAKSTKSKPSKVTTKADRQLAAAAKKADKEVKRIAKKASKTTQKTQKKSTKTTKTKTASKSSKPKKIKKLSLS